MEVEAQKQEEVGVGEWQSKLASVLNTYRDQARQAYLFEKKKRGIHQQVLAAGIRQNEGLRQACLTMVKCLAKHEDREDFAKSMMEHFN